MMSELKQVLDEIEVKVTALMTLMKYVKSLEKEESEAIQQDRERIADSIAEINQKAFEAGAGLVARQTCEAILKAVNDE